jgi:hypothetical protein
MIGFMVFKIAFRIRMRGYGFTPTKTRPVNWNEQVCVSRLPENSLTPPRALTRPWTVTRSYRRDPGQAQPEWLEVNCRQDSSRVLIGDQNYKVSPEGLLMPAVRGQKRPDLKYFK